MAQLSTDTIVYSQIIARVQQFIAEYVTQKNIPPAIFDEQYQKLLLEIHQKVGGISFDINLFQKGDIPNSLEFNKMISLMSKDLNIMTNQLESLSANYINTFNLFTNQLEAEKNFISRIKSKINVLEMYSQSPSVDVSYFGDSFNDLSKVDSRKIQAGLVPDISDGYASLAKLTSRSSKGTMRVVNQNYGENTTDEVPFAGISNGLKGNHFLFYKNLNETQFIYEKDSSILRSTESAIVDSSPATYFEYEAISVPAASFTGRPEYEFQYFNGSQYINWAKYDTSKPLKLTLEFATQNKSGEYLNHISIVPFFGYDIEGTNALIKNVKVTSLKLYNEKQNKTYELINSGPVYIASDLSQKNLENYKNFFYNKGIFRFDEKIVNKVYITFEQDEFKDTVIKHAYWTPYELNSTTKWNNQSHFQPENILNSTAKSITWDKALLVPNINRPTELKSSANDTRQVIITYNNQVSGDTKYQIKMISGQNTYFWYKKDADLNIDLFTSKENSLGFIAQDLINLTKNRIINSNYPSACVLIDPIANDPINNLKIKMGNISITSSIATLTTLNNHGLNVGDKIYIRDRWSSLDILGVFTITEAPSATQVRFAVGSSSVTTLQSTDISKNFGLCIKVIDSPTEKNVVVEKYIDFITKSTRVPLILKRNFEELKAKRASIGIRDITFGKETFQESAEIISKPFFVANNLDMVTLYSADSIPSGAQGQSYIKYSISVDGGVNFYPIQPVERNYTGIPEVLAFNQNLNNDATLPQIAYLNNGKDPGIPNPINSIVVKIQMKKDKTTNNTPIVYYYKIGARFR
jgi:hypothetical protein